MVFDKGHSGLESHWLFTQAWDAMLLSPLNKKPALVRLATNEGAHAADHRYQADAHPGGTPLHGSDLRCYARSYS